MTSAVHPFRRAEGVITRRIAGETVIIPMPGTAATGRETRFFVLNGTAERLWALLASPQTAEIMAHHLITEFDIDAAAANNDIMAFVRDLEQQGLIVRQASS